MRCLIEESLSCAGGIAVAVAHPLRPRAKHASTRKRAGRFPGPRPCCAQKATTAQGGEDAEKESSLAFLTDEKQLDAQIWTLALPAFIALCAEPLLSIIDTAFVGRLPDAALSLGGLGLLAEVRKVVWLLLTMGFAEKMQTNSLQCPASRCGYFCFRLRLPLLQLPLCGSGPFGCRGRDCEEAGRSYRGLLL